MSVLLIGIFGIAIQPSSSNGDIMNTFPRNVMAPDGLDPIDGTVDMLGSDEIAIRSKASTVGLNPMSFNKPQSISPVSIGDELNIDVADFVFGDYEETFTVVLNGVHGIILVEKAAYDNYDTSTDEFVFPNPYHPEYPEYRISMSMLTYLLG